MYERLLSATPGVTAKTLGGLFKDESFGVAPGDQERVYSPRAGPDDRARQLLRRAARLRHDARGGDVRARLRRPPRTGCSSWTRCATPAAAQLSSFAGGAAGNRAMDEEQWRLAPYTEADLQRQADQLDDLYGDEGRAADRRAPTTSPASTQYIARRARRHEDARRVRGDRQAAGARPWKVTDIIATASLVGGIFGKGGGDELTQMELRRSFVARYGARRGATLWREWAAYEDADAPTTVRWQALPLPDATAQARPRRDRDRRRGLAAAHERSSPPRAASRGRAAEPDRRAARRAARAACCREPAPPRGMSNALVVSGRESASGHPLAVFGPQVSYLAPQILMEQDVHAPGIDARGAAFPGVNLYVQLGRGRDYAFSATSAGQDIIDTFALELCEPGGGAPTMRLGALPLPRRVPADRGARALQQLGRRRSPTRRRRGSDTLRAERTKLGLVSGRATIKGKPVIYTRLRSTYMHEIDSARGFSDFNDPAKMRDAARLPARREQDRLHVQLALRRRSRHRVLQLRRQPAAREGRRRASCPMPAKHAWRGYDPDRQHGRLHVVRQAPAHDQRPAVPDVVEQQAGARLRGRRLEPLLVGLPLADARRRDRRRGSPARASSRCRGSSRRWARRRRPTCAPSRCCRWRCQVIGAPDDAAPRRRRREAARVDRRRARTAATATATGVYEHADAIRILDAFWPLWMRAQFEPSLGYDALRPARRRARPRQRAQRRRRARRLGLPDRLVRLRRQGPAPDPRAQAVKRRTPSATAAPAGARAAARCCATRCHARSTSPRPSSTPTHACAQAAQARNDQACFDAIAFRATGGVTQPMIGWQNRPTYQQAVEVRGHRRR